MSRVLTEKYIFTPGVAGAGTIKIPGPCKANQLLIIANKRTQQNIYAIGDPTKSGTIVFDPEPSDLFYSDKVGVTTITVAADTQEMLSTDELAVYMDAPNHQGTVVRPYWFGTDAIERVRVANPQAMIDADFEYGLQTTKWQNYADIRNIPGIYEKPGLDLFLDTVVTDGGTPSIVTVTCTAPHQLVLGDPVVIHGLSNVPFAGRGEGAFIITSVPNTLSFTYIAKGILGTNGQFVDGSGTYARRGGLYSAAKLNIASIVSDGLNPSTITVTTVSAHGLMPGAPLAGITTSTGTNHNLFSGNFHAEQILSSTSFKFFARVGGAVSNATTLTGNLYVRSDAISVHRPFDGGVLLGPYNPSHGASISRQTKKYMRYQSGKGMMWTSGTLFCPVYNLDQANATGTAVGSTITISTEQVHGLQEGATVIIEGVVTTGYNGTYGVSAIIDERTFQYQAANILGSASSVLTNLPRVTVSKWHGSLVRCGVFDDQNGIFWEYDGSELAAVKRSGTYQLSGTVVASPGNQTINGTNTRFTQQCYVGAKIIIRGMTYIVNGIPSDTQLFINPGYRGLNVARSVKMAIIIDTRVPQSQFNTDKLDGTGQSGYKINLAKMQMMGIQFSWYGAGFIDFMCRGPDGNMICAHRMKMNNVNREAYMRTGNATIRYQAANYGPIDFLAADIDATQVTIPLKDASRYPPTGGVVNIEGELIRYTGKTGNTLTGCVRGTVLTQFVNGLTKNFQGRPAFAHSDVNGYQSVMLVSCTATPLINHWGSSYIMDGGYDSDRGYYYNYPSINNTIPTGKSKTLFYIRLAPSVSNSIAADFGDRELINRAQLLLQKLQVQSDQSILITGMMNPGNIDASTLLFNSVNAADFGSQPSFSQISTSNSTAATPGEQIFSTLGQPGGFSEIDLSGLKELSNSAIGGYSNFPDGPDVLAIVATNYGSGITDFDVTKTETSATSNYRINGYSNPTLTLYRGETYTFNITGTAINRIVACSGTAGQFTCGLSKLAVGDLVRITGTAVTTGTITGYTTGNEYKVSAITGTSPNVTGFTLQTTANAAIATTAGSLTGLVFISSNEFGTHPLWIKTTQTIGTANAYNTGITNNGATFGKTLKFVVDIDAPNILYYNCELHTTDRGIINIIDREAASCNVNLFWTEAQS
jgi:hypothetical protein